MSEFFSTNLSQLGNISFFIIILILTFLIGYFANRFLSRTIKHSSSSMEFDPTNYHFIRHALVAVIYIIGMAAAVDRVPELRKLTNSLLAGAGIVAVAVGFASQHALSNIVSGFFIVLFKPFRIHDRISVKNKDFSGVIEDITLRHVVIRDYENRRVIVPNTIISDEIIVNSDFSDGKICKWIDVSVARQADIDLAKRILQEETLKHPLRIDTRSEEEKAENKDEVPVRVTALLDSSIELRAWAWAKGPADAFVMGCDLLETIKKRYDEAGIPAPYPHRVILQESTNK